MLELKGELYDVKQGYLDGAAYLTFRFDEMPRNLDNLEKKPLRITLARWSKKRSLTANAYYWTLVGEIAKALTQEGQPTTTAYVHNWMICDYGQPDLVDGKIHYTALPETAAAQEAALESSLYHYKPTAYVYMSRSGDIVRDYIVMKHSRFYDAQEFSQLISGAIEEAKGIGLETLPPAELERMMRDYEVNYSNGH